ncbi:DUF4861 domain-containing protein [Flavobacterium sp. Sd200]|uniref:DUF4861 family protein n=1 Tax=Flavobacterium sp. Sd200 TaxID=2692211 RepID=UPI00136BFD22|nr:DUF4861 family protein [Flavobacterium sp. Sd200]MXN90764.1 DUF4861 domain-containing protein [Flavobacterium sp. Sd200]
MKLLYAICGAAAFCLASCGSKETDTLTVEVKNSLDFDRTEIVTLKRNDIAALLKTGREEDIRIKNSTSTAYLPLQWIDYDKDGRSDELLFQATVKAGKITTYSIVTDAETAQPKSKITTYSRFVPERTDDYTWENDKVAFRVYGPTGQKEALAGVAGSTLSSGVDIWLKRTDKPIINKWYAEHAKAAGYYHTDHGEGYDPYHVGNSRGTGGSGIWDKDSLYVSENYVSYKTIAEGPLRTVFELEYAAWGPYGTTETKRVSLDLGSHFSKFEVTVGSEKPLPNYTVGITLQDNKGIAEVNTKQGWYRHWEQIDDAFVGEGLVMAQSQTDSAFVRKSDVKDQSNLLVVNKPADKIVYYAGFAWQKSGAVKTVSDWDKMLQRQAQTVANPLQVTVK